MDILSSSWANKVNKVERFSENLLWNMKSYFYVAAIMSGMQVYSYGKQSLLWWLSINIRGYCMTSSNKENQVYNTVAEKDFIAQNYPLC